MNIGVTGTIGSGKSRVCKALAHLLSASIISADTLCRDLLVVNGRGWKEVRSVLGSEFFLSDGQIDRPRLRKALFSQSGLRRQLDQILHPLVREELQAAAQKAQKQQRILLAEVPLLFEKGWQADFGLTVLVFANEETCIRRVMLRDLVSEADAKLALSAQMPIEEKIRLADSVIDNSASFAETLQQLNQLCETLQASTLLSSKGRGR